MSPDEPLRKTSTLKRLLEQRRGLTPALRMLLITVDGRRTAGELRALARALGLPDDTLEVCVQRGWITPSIQALRDSAPRLSHLLPTRTFARELASRLLRGMEDDLEDRWHAATDSRLFDDWMSRCSTEIEQRVGPEQGARFRQQVARMRHGPNAAGSGDLVESGRPGPLGPAQAS